jgi:fibronectin-binding autotransporter adhesin
MGLGPASSNNLAVVTGSGSTWSTAAELYVGNSAGIQLLISAGGAVRSGYGYVGNNNATASNNLALITGAGSTWSNALDLNIGAFSSNNRMIVSNGATVFAANNGFIGPNANDNGNSVTVTDPGTLWQAGSLFVGNNGASNSLVVSNGAQVRNNSGFIGNGASAENNLAVVTGPGTIWNNTFHTFVGFDGSDNHLIITNGGFVTNGLDALIGVNSGAEVNTVALSGLGSRWVVNRFFELGHSGDDNELLIENGASLVSGKATIGVLSASQGNQATVSGPGTTWTNLSSLEVGAAGSQNALAVFDGACLVSSNGTIGALESADRNGVAMFGPDSRWLMEGDLYVGSNGPSSVLFLIGGALVANSNGIIGGGSMSVSNLAVVTGSGSVWSNRNEIFIGQRGSGNRLEVRDGARVECQDATLGTFDSASNNVVVVTDPGSFWRIEDGDLFVGYGGGGNRLVITNGASVCGGGIIGDNSSSPNNEVVVTGAGSSWTNLNNGLVVGDVGSRNRLVITNGGLVVSEVDVTVGFEPVSTNNRIVVDGGALRALDPDNGILDVRRGTNVLNAGLIDVTRLLLTNALGFFEFNGGKLSSGNSTVNNGQLFRVGNGVSPATFALTGNGTHSFANGLTVSANALLTGNGAVSGILSVQTSGALVPGASIGKIVLSNSPSLQGATIMEISKNGATLTNDQIQVTAPLTYGGSLVVSNLGPTALATGDNFKLFSAGTFAGSFASLTLPPLNPGLGWTNKLLVDGSLEVVGFSQPKFASITVSGTNVIISGTGGPANALYAVLTATNVTLPLSSWVSIVTNQFAAGGGFSFTNGIPPGERQRYFRIRTP